MLGCCFFFAGFFFLPNEQLLFCFFNSLHNVIRNLRVNIKTEKHLRIIFFCLPEIQSAKLCIRLQFACHIRTSPEFEWTPGPDATTSTDEVQKGWKAGCQMRPSRADGVAEPTSPAKASENLTSFLQKTKQRKEKSTLRIWIHSESEELQLARTDVRTDLEVNPINPQTCAAQINLAVLLQIPRTGAETEELPLHNNSGTRAFRTGSSGWCQKM